MFLIAAATNRERICVLFLFSTQRIGFNVFLFGCCPLPVDKMRLGKRWERKGGDQHKNKIESRAGAGAGCWLHPGERLDSASSGGGGGASF